MFLEIFWLLVVGTTNVTLSNATASQHLTWTQCLTEALKQHPEILSARQKLEAAQAQLWVAYGGFLPKLAANGSYSQSNSFLQSQNILTPTTPSGSRVERYNLSLDLTQNVFSGFSDQAVLRQQEFVEETAKAQAISISAKVVFNLKLAYAALLYAQDAIKLSQTIALRRQTNYDLVRLRYEGGRENKGSLLLAEALLAQAHFEVRQARDAETYGQTQLATALGHAPGEMFHISKDIPMSFLKTTPSWQKLVDEHPDVGMSLAVEQRALAAVKQTQAGYYPQLNFTGSLGRQHLSTQDQNYWLVGANLSWPLWSGGKDYFSAQNARAQWRALEATRRQTEQQVYVTLRQTWIDFQQAIDKLAIDKQFLHATEVRADIARSKYNSGLLIFENWDVIENELIARQKAYLQSQKHRLETQASWDYAQGKEVES